MDFLTREVFDTLILAVVFVGGALAAVRLYKDLTRPLPGEDPAETVANNALPATGEDDDTQPTQTVRQSPDIEAT